MDELANWPKCTIADCNHYTMETTAYCFHHWEEMMGRNGSCGTEDELRAYVRNFRGGVNIFNLPHYENWRARRRTTKTGGQDEGSSQLGS